MATCKICGGNISCGCSLPSKDKASFLSSGLCMKHWYEEKNKTSKIKIGNVSVKNSTL